VIVLKVSAIIPTLGRRRELETVLRRLDGIRLHEVLVVANGLDPRPLEELVSTSLHASRLLSTTKNVGIAARNLAAREATGELLLMLDDDSYPLPGALEALVEAFAGRPRLGAAAGRVREVDEDGSILAESGVGTFDWFFRGGRDGPAGSEGQPTFFFPEGASLLRREAFLEVGGFFEPFVFHCEGLELATRLLARRWDVRYVPEARFDHLRHGSRAFDASSLDHRVRNQVWYFWLHFPAPLVARRVPAYLAFDLVECAYRRVPGAWVRGVVGAWRGRSAVRGRRRPLPREVVRRAELNRGRLHAKLLVHQLKRRVRRGTTSA
jgi:GT2 family glycosyltransferase